MLTALMLPALMFIVLMASFPLVGVSLRPLPPA